MKNRKLMINIILILIFTVINYKLAKNDKKINNDFFKINTPLDALYFTMISQITSFFKYNSTTEKMTKPVKLFVCIHILAVLINNLWN